MVPKGFIYKFLPPIVYDALRRLRPKKKTNTENGANKKLWYGEFESWKAALSQCNGYDDQLILKKVRNSLLKVKKGEAAYERDSMLFDKIQYSWPLLACLENVALAKNRKLHIIDFGGSLGSSFFQNRKFLANTSLKWTIVEQKHFVECGKNEFEDEFLKFENSMEDALKNNEIHCLLISGVLQYMSDPFFWIDKLCSYNIDYIILDRTGFTNQNKKVLTIQRVPQEIYEATYPCWFFNEEEFIEKFTSKYNIVTDFNDSFTPPIVTTGSKYYWKGFYLMKH